MFRIARGASLALGLMFLGQGCAHFVEERAIAKFTKALEGENLEGLKAATSETFEQKALRRSESIDDMKILRLYPEVKEGKKKPEPEIIKVEEVSENEKLVQVTIGEGKTRKLQYRLTRENKSGKWVVDDVLVKQAKKDVSAAKSVTEQMDLLNSVREFVAAWEDGDRQQILAVTAPTTSALLAELTPEQLATLAKQLMGDKPIKSKVRPEAQLDGDDAIVRLKNSEGDVALTYRLYHGNWKVVDAALETKDDKTRVASIVKTAAVLRAVDKFIAAYRADDKANLEKICTPQLFGQSLKFADTKSMPMPELKIGTEKQQVHMTAAGADLVTGSEAEVVRISLNRIDPEADSETPVRYLVHEVTLYDNAHEKRISAVFTSRQIMELFARSYAERKLDVIKKVSTTDFNQRVWDQLDTDRLMQLKVAEIEPVAPKILSTDFHGEVTEITVQQGSRVLSYILRDWSGRVCVDDVLMPTMDRPNSLKTTLEITIPIYNYLVGLRAADPTLLSHAPQIEFLQMNSSNDMNRQIWKQAEVVPSSGLAAIPYLDAPLSAIKHTDTEALVTLGDDKFGARLLLNKEHGRFVIDQMVLVSGPEANQRAELKQTMRTELASRGLRATPATRGIQYASSTEPAAEPSDAAAPRAFTPQVSAKPIGDPMTSQPVSIEPGSPSESSAENAIPKSMPRKVTPVSGTRTGKPKFVVE